MKHERIANGARKRIAKTRAQARALDAALGTGNTPGTTSYKNADVTTTNEKWNPKTGEYSADFTFDKVSITK